MFISDFNPLLDSLVSKFNLNLVWNLRLAICFFFFPNQTGIGLEKAAEQNVPAGQWHIKRVRQHYILDKYRWYNFLVYRQQGVVDGNDIKGVCFICSAQISVLKRKTLFNQRGSFVHREFHGTDSLIGCPSFFILVLKIGRNS